MSSGQAAEPGGAPPVLAALLPQHARVLVLGADLVARATQLAMAGAHCLLLDPDATVLTRLHLPAHIQPVLGDPARLALGGRTVDLILAGDQPRRLPRASLARAIASWAEHLTSGGHLVSEITRSPITTPLAADRLGRAAYDRLCQAADLAYIARYADLDGRPVTPDSAALVSVHRRR